MAAKHAKWQIFIHTKIYSLQDIQSGKKKKTKTCSEEPHLASGCFMKAFIRDYLSNKTTFE